MELWIRSQDRLRLVKATDIRIYYASAESIWVIVDCDDLGYYQTKERALEVLDEIQCHLVNINDRRDSYFYIYKMPEE